MKILASIAFLIVATSSCDDHRTELAQSSSDSEVKTEQPIQIDEILPTRMIGYASGICHGHTEILLISKDKVELQEINEDGKAVTIAAMDTDIDALQGTLVDVPRDSFRGTVKYSHPTLRDGTEWRMITPIGDISVYGVFKRPAPKNQPWPRAILALEPLFDEYYRCLSELRKQAENE